MVSLRNVCFDHVCFMCCVFTDNKMNEHNSIQLIVYAEKEMFLLLELQKFSPFWNLIKECGQCEKTVSFPSRSFTTHLFFVTMYFIHQYH